MKRLVLLGFVGVAWAGGFRAGTGAVKVTPPLGAPMAGYFSFRGVSGVHDDLWCRALVLESDGQRAALVACDVIHLPDGVVQAARALIESGTGLSGRAVMMSATHAHTGPEVKGEYAEWLPGRIAESVRLALGAMQPARLAAGEGEERTLTFNRRFVMTDGSVGWNPGKKNPKIVRAAGPVDARVGVVSVLGEDGSALATYVNYALHLDTVGGTEVSADYPYTMERMVSAALGGTAMFTLGCAGNLNHIDVTTARPQKGHGEARRIGTVLAGQVVRASAGLEELPGAPLKVSSEVLELGWAAHTAEEVVWAKGVAAKYGQPNAGPFLEMVKAMLVLDLEARKGGPLRAEVQVVTVGRELAIVGLPGEIFTELGMAIKARSPFRHTVVVSLANGHLGYVPDSKAWGEGNYEVVTARCVEGSGEQLVDTAVKLLKEARP